jgi:hypothetical protein
MPVSAGAGHSQWCHRGFAPRGIALDKVFGWYDNEWGTRAGWPISPRSSAAGFNLGNIG